MSKQFHKILLIFFFIAYIHGLEDHPEIHIPIYTSSHRKHASDTHFRRAVQSEKITKAIKNMSMDININQSNQSKSNLNVIKSEKDIRRNDRYNKRATFMSPKQATKDDNENTQEDKLNKNELEEVTSPDVIDPYTKVTEINPYDIKNYFLDLFGTFAYASVTAEVIGRTAEYNDIVLLKIADKSDGDETFWRADRDKYDHDTKEKKKIFIVHALTPIGMRNIPCLYTENQFKQLISYYLDHLKDFDIFIIPLANPDGYVKKDDNWNKNVSPQLDCGGVAVDHNFDIGWNANHTISSCSPLYPGPRPFSEAESKAVKDVLHKYATKIIAYIHVAADFHTKGDAVLYPKGYTDAQSDEDKYIDLKSEIDEAMGNAGFKDISVTVDSLYNWYGEVSGKSVDYASKVYGIPFAMEFLMKEYNTYFSNGDYVELRSHAALEQIWKRIIDTVFNFIHKSTNPTDGE